MKNLIILSVLLIGFTLSASGQKDAPVAVKKAFTQKYTDAKAVKWGSEEANEWEAEFKMNGKEMSASYDNTGKWIESETEISTKDLPAVVSATLAKEFAGYKTGEMSIFEDQTLKGYEIALKKGESTHEVLIDATGKILKNIAADKEDEKSEKAEPAIKK